MASLSSLEPRPEHGAPTLRSMLVEKLAQEDQDFDTFQALDWLDSHGLESWKTAIMAHRQKKVAALVDGRNKVDDENAQALFGPGLSIRPFISKALHECACGKALSDTEDVDVTALIFGFVNPEHRIIVSRSRERTCLCKEPANTTPFTGDRSTAFNYITANCQCMKDVIWGTSDARPVDEDYSEPIFQKWVFRTCQLQCADLHPQVARQFRCNGPTQPSVGVISTPRMHLLLNVETIVKELTTHAGFVWRGDNRPFEAMLKEAVTRLDLEGYLDAQDAASVWDFTDGQPETAEAAGLRRKENAIRMICRETGLSGQQIDTSGSVIRLVKQLPRTISCPQRTRNIPYNFPA